MSRKKSEIRCLLERALPGKRSGIEDHIRRGERMLEAIRYRFRDVDSPHSLRAKHLQWFLHRRCAHMAPATRYDYFRTCRAIGSALGRWENWKPHLQGTWVRPDGRGGRLGSGRKPNLAGRR